MNTSAPDMNSTAPDMKNAIQDMSDVSDMSKRTLSAHIEKASGAADPNDRRGNLVKVARLGRVMA